MQLLNDSEYIEQVKTSIRVKSNQESILEEIDSLIEACKNDLSLAGVVVIDLKDHYTMLAVKLYCKAHYSFNAQDNLRFQESYDMIKHSMCLSSKYRNFEK